MLYRLLFSVVFIALSAFQSFFAQNNCFTCDYDSLLLQLPEKSNYTDRVKLLTLLVDKNDISNLERNVTLTDQLLEANKEAKVIDDAPYVELRLGMIAWRDNNYNQALRHVQLAIELFDKQNKIIYDLLTNVRILFGSLNQQEERREYFERKLNQYQLSGPYQNTASCYHALGQYYLSKADYNLAITNYLRASVVYKKFQPTYYYNELIVVGGLYHKWGNEEKANFYLNEGLPLSKANKDSNATAYALIALSDININKQRYDRASNYTDDALKYSDQKRPLNSFDAIHSIALLQKGLLYVYQKKTAAARQVLLETKKIIDQYHPKLLTAAGDLETDYTFYLYSRLENNLAQAEQHLVDAFAKARDEKSHLLQKKYLKELALFYEQQNKAGLALQYVQKYISLNDTIENEQNSIKIAQFENEQKEQEQGARIASLRQEKAIQDIKISNRNIIVFVALAGLLLVMVLMAFLYRQLIINKQTLATLRKTQRQLILSEKMASLGEMTAGIAHEIENPLNFVKNFSEVSMDLMGDLKSEAERGNNEEVLALTNDVWGNLEKITYHSKRADSIVKAMLMHTKNSGGKKEMVNINDLTEEYLRLCYQGYRASDKTFTADLRLNFDGTLPLIEALPQEIGRVLYNVFSNAFYSMSEKQKKSDETYKPQLTVSTMPLEEGVSITIRDNGIGIPQPNIDKIFQPFYTTKPTGQGTGLGLSLSYDIITKGFGGKMEVNTTEGEYAEFVITI